MRITTLLKKTLNFKSFVFKKCEFGDLVKGTPTLEITIVPRRGSQGICSGCHRRCRGYDRLKERRFEHIPFWGFLVFFLYVPRRVECPRCGICVELMPWCKGKSHLTVSYSWYLSDWALRLSWQEVAHCFRSTWYYVYSAVEMAVEYGRSRMDLEGITSIGIDEVKWRKGKRYLTLVYQIDDHCKRLLWVGANRTKTTLKEFFTWFGSQRTQKLKFVCSDIWLAYINTVKELASQAVHVLDRFHIMVQINKAIDKVRADEVRKLKAKKKCPILKRTRWIFLKNKENLTLKQDQKLVELLRQNLKTVKSYLLKEYFQRLWEYLSPYWAGQFIDRWTKKVMYSRIEPMKKVARTIREHKPLILNWFKAKKKISQGVVEGMNYKAKLAFKNSYGFRTIKAVEIRLYHVLGNLPKLQTTHTFF